MVGTAGFEPATTRTPSECATRLRYVPTALILHQPTGFHLLACCSRIGALRASPAMSRSFAGRK